MDDLDMDGGDDEYALTLIVVVATAYPDITVTTF